MKSNSIPIGILAAVLCMSGPAVLAETPPLPAPGDVYAIAIKPQAKQLPEHFTPQSLLAALAHLKPAYMLEPIGGKVWSQSGVIVLKDKSVLFWRSYRDDVIAVETGGAPTIYVIDR